MKPLFSETHSTVYKARKAVTHLYHIVPGFRIAKLFPTTFDTKLNNISLLLYKIQLCLFCSIGI